VENVLEKEKKRRSGGGEERPARGSRMKRENQPPQLKNKVGGRRSEGREGGEPGGPAGKEGKKHRHRRR